MPVVVGITMGKARVVVVEDTPNVIMHHGK